MGKTKEEIDDERAPCKYGANCYQKNQAHREKYTHPTSSPSTSKEDKPEARSKKIPVKAGPLKQQKLDFFISKRKIDKVVPEENHEPDEPKRKANHIEKTERKANYTEKAESKTNYTEKAERVLNHTEKTVRKANHAEKPEREENAEIPHIDECSSDNGEIEGNTEETPEDRIEDATSSEEETTTETFVEVSEEDAKPIIKELFLVEMPEDFYSFWKFCKHLSPQSPKDALRVIDLTLVGPFDILAGTLKKDSVDSSEAVLHWRYYYDPPEFQTILKSDKDLFHLGYFRDDPNSPPVFVAYNSAAKDSFISHIAENIFGAVDWYISFSEKSSNPFKKMKSSNIKTSLQDWAKEHNFTLEKNTKKMQERNKSVVSKTFHQAGIVVPYDKKTQLGYRPLSETPNNLKKLLKKIESAKSTEERLAHFNSLHTIVNWANIAMDEGDFGTNLELGLSLFSYGTDHFNSIIRSSLQNAYNFLNREAFATIIEAHLKKRKRGGNLDVSKNK